MLIIKDIACLDSIIKKVLIMISKKYSLMLIISVLIVGHVIPQMPDKEKIALAITSAHTAAFSKDNLIISRLTENDQRLWDEAVKAAKIFVTENSSAHIKYLNRIDKANNALINTLKSAFNGYIAPALKNPNDKKEGLSRIDSSKIDLTKINIVKLEALVNTLQTTVDDMRQMQDELKSKPTFWIIWTTDKKNKYIEANDLLNRLALTLDATAGKVITDTIKKLKPIIQSAAIKPTH